MKLDDMVSYSQFKFWFIRLSLNCWKVVDKVSNEEIGTFTEGDVTSPYFNEFQSFMLRPEYFVGRPIKFIDTPQISDIREAYELLISGAWLMRRREKYFLSAHSPSEFLDVDDILKNCHKLMKWLDDSKFFYAPASTQYHESYEGGLAIHSLKVYNEILGLLKLDKFSQVTLQSATIVALCHDWCKIRLYEAYDRNVKNDVTGKWEKQKAFRCNQTGVPLGHGVSSMFLASKFFSLSFEESLAIRWHMGAWRVVESEMNELQLANEKCPLVHALQFADQLSIVEY